MKLALYHLDKNSGDKIRSRNVYRLGIRNTSELIVYRLRPSCILGQKHVMVFDLATTSVFFLFFLLLNSEFVLSTGRHAIILQLGVLA